MGCGVGRRRGSDPMLLWLWRKLAAAALIRPLAWEPPYATGVALGKTKKKEKEKKNSITVIAFSLTARIITKSLLKRILNLYYLYLFFFLILETLFIEDRHTY